MGKDSVSSNDVDCSIQHLRELLIKLDHEIENLEDILAATKRIRDSVKELTQNVSEGIKTDQTF